MMAPAPALQTAVQYVPHTCSYGNVVKLSDWLADLLADLPHPLSLKSNDKFDSMLSWAASDCQQPKGLFFPGRKFFSMSGEGKSRARVTLLMYAV